MTSDFDIPTLIALVAHFGGCAQCCDDHGEFPESVSCYCCCHDGAEERWADTLQAAARNLFGPRKKEEWEQ